MTLTVQKRLVDRPFMLALLIFVVSALGYVAYYKVITNDYFGGDVVTLFNKNMTSYGLTLPMVADKAGLARQILADKNQDSAQSPGAFAHARLSVEGRKAVKRLAEDPASAPDQELFILEFNRALVDVDPGWPASMLAKYGADTVTRDDGDTSLYNRKVLGLFFKPHIKPWKLMTDPGAIFKHIVIGGRANFTLNTPTRYAPLAVSYVTFMILYLQGGMERFPVAVAQMAVIFGCMVLGVYLFSRKILRDALPALLATVLFATSLTVITSSMMVFSLPYLFVTITMCFALYGYLQYKDSGKTFWLLMYMFFGIIGPWTREFPGLTPFIVIACELMDFRGRRSGLLLLVSMLLAGHALYPSLLPWLLGWNKGQVFSLLAMGKSQMHTTLEPNWHLAGFVFVHMPPVIWLLAVAGICLFIVSWQALAVEQDRPAPVWVRVVRCCIPRSERGLAVGKALLLLLVLWLTYNFVMCLCVTNVGLQHFSFIKDGHWLFLFMAMISLFSLKHHHLPSVFFLAFLVGYMRWNVAEVHLSFMMPPLAIMLVAWMRDLYERFRNSKAPLGKAAFVILCCLSLIGISDQMFNIYSTAVVQRRLVECNKELGAWLRDNAPKHSIVIANFFYYTDLYYYSRYHFDPYESVENNPFGPNKTIHTDEQMNSLLANNGGRRDVYLIEAEHPFFDWQRGYHSHKWVKTPLCKLERVAHFSLNIPYVYIDPLRHFTPRFWISFPGYMDWFTDYWWDKQGLFRRSVWSDYSIYKLTGVNMEYLKP